MYRKRIAFIACLSLLFISNSSSAGSAKDALLLFEIFSNVDLDITFRDVQYDVDGAAFPGEETVNYFYEAGDNAPKILKMKAGDYYISSMSTGAYGISTNSPQYAEKIIVKPDAANYLGTLKVNASIGERRLLRKYYDDSGQFFDKLTAGESELVSRYNFNNLKMVDSEDNNNEIYRFKSSKKYTLEEIVRDCNDFKNTAPKKGLRSNVEPIFAYIRPVLSYYFYQVQSRKRTSIKTDVDFVVSITPNGNICDARITNSELGDNELENKLLEVLSTFNFGKYDIQYTTANLEAHYRY